MRAIIKFLYHNLHWVLTVFLVVYTIIPFLSPIFFHFGLFRAGWWIQTIYRFLCHQRPERSLFLFGEHLTYSLEELGNYGYTPGVLGYPFIGNETLGYKVAFCMRDIFLYAFMALSGIIVSLKSKKISIPWWVLALGLAPMALDGAIQFVSEFTYLTQDRWNLVLANPWYLSNNITRAVTGGLFGFTIGVFIFSELKDALRYNSEKTTNDQRE